MLGLGNDSPHCSSQQPDPTKIRDNEAVNICSKPFKKAQTGHYKVAKETGVKAKTITSTDRQNETEILSQIIQYEQKIGRQPTMLDLLCRFPREELEAVWQDLLWLYSDIGETEWSSTTDIKQVVAQ